MDQKEIFEYMSRFEASSIRTMEIEIDGLKLKLDKGQEVVYQAAPVQTIEASQVAVPEAQAQTANAASAQNAASAPAQAQGLTVNSPIVGIFYKAPAPDKAPFVEVGMKVKAGDVMCIIEAMKMMNEIKAPYDLIVKRAFVSDGEMVECEMPLFEVEKC